MARVLLVEEPGVSMDLRYILASICNASSTDEALLKYSVVRSLLREHKIVLSSDRGPSLGFTASRSFQGGAVVRNLFSSENVVVLDSETVDEMQGGKSSFFTDYSISLDTQAVSYLRPYMRGVRNDRLPTDMAEVFAFISRADVQVDPMPYVLENLHNLGVEKREKNIREILTSYEVLRTVDVRYLESYGLVRSMLSESELRVSTDAHFARMKCRRADTGFYESLVHRHRCMYAYLLKMVEIKLSSLFSSIDEMMVEFLDFCHKDMACIAAREVVLARAYFEKGQDLAFFGKIQKNRDDLFANLDGMAWDLYHVRQLEETLTFDVNPKARYYFPALLTFDKRLIEVMDLYPLIAISYKKGGGDLMPFYAGDWLRSVATSDEQRAFVLSRFYSDDAWGERRANIGSD